MNEPLSEAEKNFLRGLAEYDIWRQILDKLARTERMPRFRPTLVSNDNPVEKQLYSWTYISGKQDAMEQLLSLLRQKEVKLEEIHE